MTAWILRLLLLCLVGGGAIAGWHASAGLADSVAAGRVPSDRGREIRGPSGVALSSRVAGDLASINARRSARGDGARSRVVVLERVAFERSAGGVVARGSIADLGAPRPVVAVVDAFDASRDYVASGSYRFPTAQGSSPFSVSMVDDDRYASFSVRFLDESMQEIPTRTVDSAPGRTPPLLADDELRAGDVGEVAALLAGLGYLPARGARDDVTILPALVRFRSDRALRGPDLVTVGDLLALRTASPGMRRVVDLASY